MTILRYVRAHPGIATPDVVNDYDSALAENMMLAAHSLEVGRCWIGLALGLRDDKEFRREAAVLEGHKLVAPIIFGYPTKGDFKAPLRKADVIKMDELRKKQKNEVE